MTSAGNVTSELVRYSRSMLTMAGVITLIIMVIGVIGNSLTIVALVRHSKLRTVAAAFIASLCISDLLICFLVLPFAASQFFHGTWIHGTFLCILVPFFRYGSVGVSLLSIAMISINRYILIAWPDLYGKVYTKLKVCLYISGIWLIAYGLHLPTLAGVWGMFGLDKKLGTCSIREDKNGNTPKVSLFIIGFALPCIVIVVCYAKIYCVVRKSNKRIESHVSTTKKSEMHITKMVLVIFFCFVICYLPLTLVKVFDENVRIPPLHVGMASQLFLRKQLLQLKLEEGKPLNNHFLAFDKLIRELKACGATLSEIDIVCHLLLTLPKSFEMVVTALETIEESNLTLELLDEEAKKFGRIAKITENATAFSGNYNNRRRQGQNRNFPFKCHHCGVVGHKRSDCKQKINKKNYKRNSANSSLKEDDENEIAFMNEAILAAVYLLNRSLTSALGNTTPAELWYGEKPNISKLRVFGCTAYLHTPKDLHTKFDPKCKKLVMIGYTNNEYKLWDHHCKIVIRRDIKFLEDKFGIQENIYEEDRDINDEAFQENIKKEENKNKSIREEAEEEKDNEDSKRDGTTTEKRTRKLPSWHDDYDMGITALNAQAYVEEIPTTIDQLDGRSDREFWLEAVKTELEAHQKNGTWELVEPPENRKIINCKWVFKITRDEEGNVERCKARLVAKGCAQQQGFDYDIVY
ncbi:hypothetical protein Trydic_g7751 [Trypoxylus dichotomus]